MKSTNFCFTEKSLFRNVGSDCFSSLSFFTLNFIGLLGLSGQISRPEGYFTILFLCLNP